MSGPGLQLSSKEAAAGAGVTVAGTGFGQCPGKGLGDSVQLLWDTATLGGPVGLDGNGAFNVEVTIPAAATAGSGHTVAAECYDPEPGRRLRRPRQGAVQRDAANVTHLPDLEHTSPASTSPTSPTSTRDATHLPGLDAADVTHLPGLDATDRDPDKRPDLDHVLADGDPRPALDTLRWPVVAGRTDRGPWRRPGGGGRAPGRAAGDARQSPAAKQLLGAPAPAGKAQPLDAAPANARVNSRPGAAPLSIGLEPHPDRLGNQQVKEITP